MLTRVGKTQAWGVWNVGGGQGGKPHVPCAKGGPSPSNCSGEKGHLKPVLANADAT